MSPQTEESVHDPVTLVIDIGKTRTKLLVIDSTGAVLERRERASFPRRSTLGYASLDIEGIARWLRACVLESAHSNRCTDVVATTHGAALVALDRNGAVIWEPMDYEAPEPSADDALAAQYDCERDDPRLTGAPDLAAGLNAARQLFWLEHMHPELLRDVAYLLPYPQYWAFLLSGVPATEVTSLGCHTQLWLPRSGQFSQLAQRHGWDKLFPGTRPAWESLGTVRPQIADDWGLPPACRVHVGVHDSNACLLRYLGRDGRNEGATLVSTGTWIILMTSGVDDTEAGCFDALNVDVQGRCGPSERFMGGRLFSLLGGSTSPTEPHSAALHSILKRNLFVFPCVDAKGATSRESFVVCEDGKELSETILEAMPSAVRLTLASIFCAQFTSYLDETIWCQPSKPHKLIVDGPFSRNQAYLQVLQSLDPARPCYSSSDPLEGTARGAWALCDWPARAGVSPIERVVSNLPSEQIARYDNQWRDIGRRRGVFGAMP